MTPIATAELVLVRHAPAETGGRVSGRRDVPACLGDQAALDRLAELLAGCVDVVTSPALRCRQTAMALFHRGDVAADPRLWEQDFGAHEGLLPHELPDAGELSRADLADLAPPGGESFAEMAARAAPALNDLARRAMALGPVAVVAHAGTVRAGLALALGDVPAGLAFEIAPLSITRIRCLPGAFAIVCVNVTA